MYKTSDNYKARIDDGNVAGSFISGTIKMSNGTEIQLSNDNIKSGTVNISLQACSSKLQIGTAIKGQLTFSFYNDISNQYALIGSTVKLSYQLDDDIIPLGIYIVSSTSRSGNCISLTCYDNMMKLDKNIGNKGTNGTPYNILSWISKNAGVELAQTEEEISQMTNGTEVVNVGVGVYSSYIDILKDIAGMLGGFATINRSGQLEIRTYQTEPCRTLQVRQRLSTKISDYQCYITELVSNINSIVYTNTTGDGSGLTYNFSSKMINGNTTSINKMLRNVLNKISKIDYIPSEIKIISDPSIDLGDMITIIPDGRTVKENTNTLITSISWVYKSSNQIKSVGENPYLSSSSSTSSSASSSSSAIAKNNSTYIATYENAQTFDLAEKEVVISSIDYTNGENDIVVIGGQCEIGITTPGTVQIGYYQQDVKNTFMPEQYLTEGKHILNFSCHFLTEDKNALVNYQITLSSKDAKGKIDIDKIRTYTLGTTTSEGKFITNNVFTEEIDMRKYKNNIKPLGYKEDDKDV